MDSAQKQKLSFSNRKDSIPVNLVNNYRVNSISTNDYSNEKVHSMKYTNNSNYLTWKEKLYLFLGTNGFKTYAFIISVVTIFIDDIKMLITSKNADAYFDYIYILLCILIFLEVIIYFIADENYGCGLFFFMDIVGLVSMILEISKISDQAVYKEADLNANHSYVFNKVQKSIKIFRIVRMGKIFKMYNHLFSTKHYKDKEKNPMRDGANMSSRFEEFSSNKLLILFILILIAIIIFNQNLYYNTPIYGSEYSINLFSGTIEFFKVNTNMAILMFTSFLEFFGSKKENNVLIYAKFDRLVYINNEFNEKIRRADQLLYYENCSYEDMNIDDINNTIKDFDETITNDFGSRYTLTLDDFNFYKVKENNIENRANISVINSNLLFFINNGSVYQTNYTFGRQNENANATFYQNSINKLYDLDLLPSEDFLQNNCVAVFDSRFNTKKYCIMNIIRTIFSLSIFFCGFMIFLVDINNTVLSPIENMTLKIENMSKNPISTLENPGTEIIKKKGINISCLQNSKDGYQMFESQILESKISKICSLLSLGFGEAGSQIISSVLQEGSNVEMNPIIPGKKVFGIYGFCDIRNFTDTTEVLQEQVMIFVNQVAEIVHEITCDFCGSANKNIGDAFLLVWKFEDKFIRKINNKRGEIELKLKKTIQVSQFCDMALISFIKILMEIQKSYKLAVYRKHPGLNRRIKNYKTRLGFGLHLGQSIEGAIGSMFKIDASYLSPNVNKANDLEENTKTFQKELIISGEFYDYLSEDSKKNLRLLDIFKDKKGEIIRLYSIDLDLEKLPIEKMEDSNFKETEIGKKMSNIKEKRKLAKILYDDVVLRHKNDVWNDFILEDDDFRTVREKYVDPFIDAYNKGMENFRNGNWTEAKNLLNSAKNILGEDDPACDRNLNFMAKTNYVVPNGWKGYKEEED